MRYTLIGHVCKDQLTDGEPSLWQWGGTVVYGGVMAVQLGAETQVITACKAPQLRIVADFDIRWHIYHDPQTTTFMNRYNAVNGHRTQYLSARASSMTLDLTTISHADIVHLAPIAFEIEGETILTLAKTGGDTWLVATPQGWMRKVNAHQQVEAIRWELATTLLPYLQAVVFSEEDIQGDTALLQTYVGSGTTILYTRGAQGATLFHRHETYEIPAFKTEVNDLTGAGDVAATAFFIRYYETRNPIEAAHFSMAAASLAIEASYVTGIPTRQMIKDRLATRQADLLP